MRLFREIFLLLAGEEALRVFGDLPLVHGAEVRMVEAVTESGFAFPVLLLYRLLE